MKNLPLTSIAIITFTSLPCFAETENFDMTLSGDFSKDYCELSVSNTAPYITIDSSLLNQYQQHIGDGNEIVYEVYESLNSIATVTCSAGEYNVHISDYNDYGTFWFGDINGYIYADHYIGGTFHANESINNMMAIPLMGPTYGATTPSATITNGTSEVARFELSYKFYATEQDQ